MPSQPNTLPIRAKIYVAAVIAAGVGILGYSVGTVATTNVPRDWLVLAALALLTGSFNIKIPSIPARISVSEAFVFAAVLLYGREPATVIVVLDAVTASLRSRGNKKSAYRTPFNIAIAALAIWLSSSLFLTIIETDRPAASLPLDRLLLPLIVLALSHFALNSGLVAGAMSLERGEPAFTLWKTSFLWLGLNYLGGASFAALIVSYRQRIDLTMLGVIVPLLVITYLTFRTSLGRVEDANRHVSQLNELYLSTIETLAMAVDAKDQITHGHIRRVQVYATELARRLGVNNERQLKAIEAAALLHDMGKLAIPEHILNKPGKLSSTEFDEMKRHADIGADLLSAVRFPYPVVPIVRHHHENWDGSGYPSGISGTDIPIGARVLSVVDCFDALTSDRPYRPRLSNDEAFRILLERRGSMYDPLVVDAFVQSFPEIAPAAIAAGQQAPSVIPAYELTDSRLARISKKPIRADAQTTTLIRDTTRAIRSSNSISDAFDIAAQCIRHSTTATVCVLFRPGAHADTLTLDYIAGGGSELAGIAIHNGERITGWCAANQQTVCNSDPILDLGNVARLFRPPLRSAISTPLLMNGETIGVLTAYSSVHEAFNRDDRYLFEQIADGLSGCVSRMLPKDRSSVIRFSELSKHRTF